MARRPVEDGLDLSQARQHLKRSGEHVRSLVVRYTDAEHQLLESGADDTAELLEQRRLTLSEIRKLVQDLTDTLRPVSGLLD